MLFMERPLVPPIPNSVVSKIPPQISTTHLIIVLIIISFFEFGVQTLRVSPVRFRLGCLPGPRPGFRARPERRGGPSSQTQNPRRLLWAYRLLLRVS